jgi:cell division protein FtsB
MVSLGATFRAVGPFTWFARLATTTCRILDDLLQGVTVDSVRRVLEKPLRMVAATGLLALGGLGLMAMDPHGARRLRRLESEIRAGDEHNRQLREENARLGREIRSLETDARAVERAAREELGLIKQGEVVFAF